MKHSSILKLHRPPALASLVCAAFAVFEGAVQAQVNLNSSISLDMGTGVYTYSYSVMNDGPLFDLALVTLPVPSGSNLFGFTAPTGFGISYDPGIGAVSFFEDANLFTPQTFAPASTVGLFSFMSPLPPQPATFTALDAIGTTFTGQVQAPAIPEPATLFWGLGIFATAACSRVRSKASAQPAL